MIIESQKSPLVAFIARGAGKPGIVEVGNCWEWGSWRTGEVGTGRWGRLWTRPSDALKRRAAERFFLPPTLEETLTAFRQQVRTLSDQVPQIEDEASQALYVKVRI
jgi:hypothetical protein